jgi:hypothetical protein
MDYFREWNSLLDRELVLEKENIVVQWYVFSFYMVVYPGRGVLHDMLMPLQLRVLIGVERSYIFPV